MSEPEITWDPSSQFPAQRVEVSVWTLHDQDKHTAALTDYQIDQHIAATSKFAYVLTPEERRLDLQRQREEARERLGLPGRPV